MAATCSLMQHPPSTPDWRDVKHSAEHVESSRTGAAPLLFGILGSIVFSHMHRVLRRFCVRNPGVLRRAQLFCDSCASTCWLLGCAAAETACGTYTRAGAGRTFAEIYAASAYPSHQSLNESNVRTTAHLELWTLVELIEHGLGGATADIAAPGTHQPAAGGMGTASCNGPMIALTGSDFEGVDHKGRQGINDTAGWATLLPLLVPSLLLPLLFAAVRCDAFHGTEGESPPPAARQRRKGFVQWCKRRGPSGLPRGVVVRRSFRITVVLAFYGVVSETLTSAMVFFVVNQFTSHRFEVRSSGSSCFLLRERREHSS